MLEMTGHAVPSHLTNDVQALTCATLAHADFRSGFEAALEAYTELCEEEERRLTCAEVVEAVSKSLDPQYRAREKAFADYLGHGPSRLLFEQGFHAGWIFAHISCLDTPVPSLDA